MSAGLLQLIRSVGLAAIVEGTLFDPAGAETILDFSDWLNWSLPERGDFVWYSWTRGCSLRMPQCDGTSTEADNWHESLPDNESPSYGAVIASADGWGAGVASAGAPAEPSTESQPVSTVPFLPIPGDTAIEEGLLVGPSTPPEVGDAVTADSPRVAAEAPAAEAPATEAPITEVPVTDPAPVGAPREVPTVEPARNNPSALATGSVPDSAVLPVSEMTATGTQTPFVAVDGAPKVTPAEEASVLVRDTQAALPALQMGCGYAGVPAPTTPAAALEFARACLVEATQLKARVAGLQFAILQRDTSDDLLPDETMAWIYAAQDHLAVLSEQVASKRPYGAVDADPADAAPRGAEPSTKRRRRD